MENEIEIWKDVVGYEGKYLVSNHGVIKSLDRFSDYRSRKVSGKIITQWYNHRGYKLVSLHNNGKRGFAVHTLVAKAFVNNPDNKPEVNHKDGNKENNFYKNLEWTTRLENQQHSVYELGKHFAGEVHWKSKLTVDDVLKMRELYSKKEMKIIDIAKLYNVNAKHAQKIISGKSWKILKRA